MICPNCGRSMSPADEWSPVKLRTAQMGLGGMPIPDAAEYWRETTDHRPTVQSNVVVPFLQAVATALASAFVLTPVAVVAGWPWWVVLIGGGVVFALAWLMLVGMFNGLLRSVEKIKAAEPVAAETPRAVTRLSITLPDSGYREDQVDSTAEKIITVSRRVIAGLPFSERALVGTVLQNRDEYLAMREDLFRLGWLKWKDERNHRAGIEPRPAGEAAMRAIVDGRVTVEELPGPTLPPTA